MAQTEYDRELKARRDAEAEVTRLRVLLSGQAARLTALSGDSKRQEVKQQLIKEYNESLAGLEDVKTQGGEGHDLGGDGGALCCQEVSATLGRNFAVAYFTSLVLGRWMAHRPISGVH